jgi:hypothetical protein
MRLVALIATFEQGDQGCLDIVFRRCEDQELSGFGIVGGQQHSTVASVTIQKPSSQEKCGSLVGLAARLSASDPKRQDGGGLDGIVNVVDRPEGSLKALEVLRFVEPLIRLAQGAIDRHRQTECWSDQ